MIPRLASLGSNTIDLEQSRSRPSILFIERLGEASSGNPFVTGFFFRLEDFFLPIMRMAEPLLLVLPLLTMLVLPSPLPFRGNELPDDATVLLEGDDDEEATTPHSCNSRSPYSSNKGENRLL